MNVRGPEILMVAMAPMPCGVAMAQMVSLVKKPEFNIMFRTAGRPHCHPQTGSNLVLEQRPQVAFGEWVGLAGHTEVQQQEQRRLRGRNATRARRCTIFR